VARSDPPIVIAHRGLPALFPEHTLEGYRRAIALGADYIEPDLVVTRDGVLVARHENELSYTTDVAQRFPERRSSRTIDGVRLEGWFAEDLTLAELRTLRTRQAFDDRPHDLDGLYAIPTFDEVLDLAVTASREVGRRIGVYPETKHPSYFEGIGLPQGPEVLRQLAAHGFSDHHDPAFVQSFERGNLEVLRGVTRLRLIRLLDPVNGPPSAADLRAIATYADGVGVEKSAVIQWDGRPTDLVPLAHDAGLLVHVYTFRPEPRFLPPWAAGDPAAELRRFLDTGVDGMFCDDADQAVRTRLAWSDRGLRSS
jgi:glycerophosphoryl diester phosphodiesterase